MGVSDALIADVLAFGQAVMTVVRDDRDSSFAWMVSGSRLERTTSGKQRSRQMRGDEGAVWWICSLEYGPS